MDVRHIFKNSFYGWKQQLQKQQIASLSSLNLDVSSHLKLKLLFLEKDVCHRFQE